MSHTNIYAIVMPKFDIARVALVLNVKIYLVYSCVYMCSINTHVCGVFTRMCCIVATLNGNVC